MLGSKIHMKAVTSLGLYGNSGNGSIGRKPQFSMFGKQDGGIYPPLACILWNNFKNSTLVKISNIHRAINP
ncbi:MAG: hypothetical protein AAGU27_21690 [Dehalobacterium sp.]